jgi:hypothetical protein
MQADRPDWDKFFFPGGAEMGNGYRNRDRASVFRVRLELALEPHAVSPKANISLEQRI